MNTLKNKSKVRKRGSDLGVISPKLKIGLCEFYKIFLKSDG